MLSMALELNASAAGQVTGIVLTGGFSPGDAVLAALRAASLFTYLVKSDTYRTAQAVDEILVKTHPTDTDKIDTIIQLVDRSLDIGDFLAWVKATGAPLSAAATPARQRKGGPR